MKITKTLIAAASAAMILASCSQPKTQTQILAETIANDTLMNQVEAMARQVVKGGFNAGDGYGEVWIRDFNTFIELSCEELDHQAIKDNLMVFFDFQGPTGDIVDGFLPYEKAEFKPDGYKYRMSKLSPQYVAHKNTVETDHESALVQAFAKYIKRTGDTAVLSTVVDGKTVLDRLEWAMQWLMNERYNAQYGLLWGATTADWGDVQPEHFWGVELDENSHIAIDIYDNAMFIVSLNHLIELLPDAAKKEQWTKVKNQIAENTMKHLWDAENQKFIPHIYMDGSPFPADFDENQIFYHGGTTVAIEAGLLSPQQIAISNQKMLDNVAASGAPSIGLTLYPPYPKGFFMGEGMYPYGYQNGGDWTWFGARTIMALTDNGFVEEAYAEIQPMLNRIVKNQGFYEWYGVDGTPSGSGTFRGEAGVLATAIWKLKEWAEKNK